MKKDKGQRRFASMNHNPQVLSFSLLSFPLSSLSSSLFLYIFLSHKFSVVLNLKKRCLPIFVVFFSMSFLFQCLFNSTLFFSFVLFCFLFSTFGVNFLCFVLFALDLSFPSLSPLSFSFFFFFFFSLLFANRLEHPRRE